MQGYEIKSNLLKARFNMVAFSLKESCCVILLSKQTLRESVIRSFEKGQKFLLEGSEPLFTKPYELLMTHGENEASMATHILKMVA